jgi:EmrB/QacA subfamily drug resistance transporter
MTATAPAEVREDGTVRKRRNQRIVGALLLGLVLASIDQTVVAASLPTILADLDGAGHVAWVVTPYLLATTVTIPIYGRLGDTYGRKNLFRVAIALFLVGSACSGLARSMLQLSLFRTVQGIGGGGLTVLAQSAMADHVTPRERGQFAGLIAAVVGVSNSAGPLVGAFLTDHVGWRAVFYLNVPVGVAALVAITRVLPADARRNDSKFPVGDAALLTLAMSLLVLVTVWGGQVFAWGSPVILGMLASGAALLAVFVRVERQRAAPVVPLRVFANRVVPFTAALSLIVGMLMFCLTNYIPLYRRMTEDTDSTSSALLLVPMMLSLVVTSILTGRLMSKSGQYKSILVAGTTFLLVGVALMTTLERSISSMRVIGYMAVVGIGLGLVNPVVLVAAQNAVDNRDVGVTTSVGHFFRATGGSVGVALFGSLLNARVRTGIARSGLPIRVEDLTPATVHALPVASEDRVLDVYVAAIQHVFRLAVPLMAVAVVLALAVEARQLRGR